MSFYELPHPWDPNYAIPRYVMAEPPERGTFTTRWLPRGTIPTLVPNYLAQPQKPGKKLLGRADAGLSGLGAIAPTARGCCDGGGLQDDCCSTRQVGRYRRTRQVAKLGSLTRSSLAGSSLAGSTLSGTSLSGNSLGDEIYTLKPLGADPDQTKTSTEAPVAPAPKPGVDLKKVAMVGAAVLGAYYLFGKKRRGR